LEEVGGVGAEPPQNQQQAAMYLATFFHSTTESIAKFQQILDETGKKQSEILQKYL